MDRLRVLEVIRQGQIGGGESHMLDLVGNLNKEQFEPLVLSFTDGPMLDRLSSMNVKWFLINTTKPFDNRVTGEVVELMKTERIDLVHAHGTRAMSNVVWASKKLKLPVIYTIHGWSFHSGQSLPTRLARIASEQYLTHKASCNISVSASNQSTGKRSLLSFDSVVINNGIDLKKFDPDKNYKDIRKELDINDDTLLVGFIARMTYQKAPLVMVQAFKEFVDQYPQTHMLMVGGGDMDEEVQDLIKKEGLKDNITPVPFRQDVPDLLSAIDIYCLPSFWDLGLIEAMAMKKPVIATHVDGTSELISNNVNGLLIEPGSVPELKNALLKLATNDDIRKKMGLAAYQVAKENHDVNKMVHNVELLYQRYQN